MKDMETERKKERKKERKRGIMIERQRLREGMKENYRENMMTSISLNQKLGCFSVMFNFCDSATNTLLHSTKTFG